MLVGRVMDMVRGWSVRRCSRRRLTVAGLAIGLTVVVLMVMPIAGQSEATVDYIEGVVQSSGGPEAGVWVIAETSDLPTHFIKIVVTGDDGRFVLPELPDAIYDVWTRGYGLVDSEAVSIRPGADVTLQATGARTQEEAARVYPANYW